MEVYALKKGVVILIVVLIVLAVVACVILYNAYGGTKNALDNPAQAFTSGGEDNQGLSTNDVQYNVNADLNKITINGQNYEAKENVTNILLLGVDKDSTRQDIGRSDMIMLCTINFDTNQITCTSVPRDTRAKVYHINDDGSIKSDVVEKINHAYAYGGGASKYSAENSMRCVSELLACDGLINVPIDYYISIDLDGLSKLASALGGVEVTLDQNVPEVGSKGQTVNLKGDTVRLFLQNRHDMDDGETTRQLHEQMFIKAMAREIKEQGAVASAPELYDTFTKFMRTNLSLDQVLSFAAVLDKTNIDDMKFNLIEGAGEMIDGIWYFRAQQDSMINLMLDALYDKV